jgi:DNA invertase Pin-like site-specific DNA recombinase
MAKTVLAWLRVSGLAQSKSDKEGIPVQKKQIEKLCRRFGLEVPPDGWYQLGMRVDKKGTIVSELSGTLVQDSDEFRQIRERLANDQTLSGLVVAKIDRLIRFDKISFHRYSRQTV